MTSVIAWVLAACLTPPAHAAELPELGEALRRPAGGRRIDLTGALRLRGLAIADEVRRDLRLRSDVSAVAPAASVPGVAVRTRLDLRSTEDGGGAIAVPRIWGEALTPFGVLAAGRMGSHWGMGLVANGGDCLDCDGVDAVDRIAIVTPLAGHHFAVAYDIDPAGDARAVTVGALRWDDHGRRDLGYGLSASRLWQDEDRGLPRGLRAWLLDAYVRVAAAGFIAEAEAAWRLAKVDQPSLLPGVLLRRPGWANQAGAVVRIERGTPRVAAGVTAGWASGDERSDDLRLDAFRAHPDFHVDRLLFRQAVGAFAAAWFARPHIRGSLTGFGAGDLHAELRATWSQATAHGDAPHGLEPGGSLRYVSRDGFEAAAEYAILLPRQTQAIYGRLGYGF